MKGFTFSLKKVFNKSYCPNINGRIIKEIFNIKLLDNNDTKRASNPMKIKNKKRKVKTLSKKSLVEIILTSLLFCIVAIGYRLAPSPFFTPTIESTSIKTLAIFTITDSIFAENLVKKICKYDLGELL